MVPLTILVRFGRSPKGQLTPLCRTTWRRVLVAIDREFSRPVSVSVCVHWSRAGLSVAVVEQFDFASGTSSRSTKLIHGGVRYLQKAILGFDVEQYRMVKEALAERANLIEIAPHLAYPLPIMLPVYKLDLVSSLVA